VYRRLIGQWTGFALVVCAPAASFAQTITWERVAKVGEPVPGLDGMVFKATSIAQIDNTGSVLTRVCWGRPGPPIPPAWCGLMYGPPGDPVFFQEQDTQAPGLPRGTTFNGGSSYSLARSGFVGTLSTLNAPVDSDHAIYSGVPASMLQLVDAEGQPYPAQNSQTTLALSLPGINSTGQVVYHSFLTNAPPEALTPGALSLAVPGAVTLVGQDGAEVAAIPGALHQYIGFNGFDLNDQGTVLYTSELSGPNISPQDSFAFLLHTASSNSVVARTGFQAPDMAPGVTFVGLASYPRLANSGSVGFLGAVQGPGIDASNNIGIWAGEADALQVVATTGDTLPGLEPGIDINGFGSILLSHSDRLFFQGFLRGDGVTVFNDQALWTADAHGEPELLLREGTQAFGLPDGVNFLFFMPSSNVPSPRFAQNAEGDVLLAVGLTGPGVTEANNHSLWFRDSYTGIWSLILRTGDQIDGMTIAPAGGVVGSSISLEGASNSIGNAFSQSLVDDGTFAVRLRFLPVAPIYSGVYRFTVPEPSSAILALVYAMLVNVRIRHK